MSEAPHPSRHRRSAHHVGLTAAVAAVAAVTTLGGAGALAAIAVPAAHHQHHVTSAAATTALGLPARTAAETSSAGRTRGDADVPGAGPRPRASSPITAVFV